MGKKRARRQFTPAELEIMKVLWEAGESTVRSVREKLPGHPGPAYNTVQTLLNILHRKGKVRRTLKGKSYEYAPKVSREGAVSHAISDLLDRLFGGSAEDLVMTLVRDRHLTPEKLEHLKHLVEQTQTGRRDAEH